MAAAPNYQGNNSLQSSARRLVEHWWSCFPSAVSTGEWQRQCCVTADTAVSCVVEPSLSDCTLCRITAACYIVCNKPNSGQTLLLPPNPVLLGPVDNLCYSSYFPGSTTCKDGLDLNLVFQYATTIQSLNNYRIFTIPNLFIIYLAMATMTLHISNTHANSFDKSESKSSASSTSGQ